MMNKLCKFQHVYYESTHKAFVTTCTNPDCPHHCTPASNLVCGECPDKVLPDASDQQFMEAVVKEVLYELPLRTEEEQRELLETYCLKCNNLDDFHKVCTNCTCVVRMAIDDFVKYAHLHCPLELW